MAARVTGTDREVVDLLSAVVWMDRRHVAAMQSKGLWLGTDVSDAWLSAGSEYEFGVARSAFAYPRRGHKRSRQQRDRFKRIAQLIAAAHLAHCNRIARQMQISRSDAAPSEESTTTNRSRSASDSAATSGLPRVGELAVHLFDLHGRLPSEALIEARLLVDARKVPCCPECEAWLRRQLKGLGKEER